MNGEYRSGYNGLPGALVEDETGDKLYKLEWLFELNRDYLELKHFFIYERQTTRHKYVATQRWGWHDERDDNMTDNEVIVSDGAVELTKKIISDYLLNVKVKLP